MKRHPAYRDRGLRTLSRRVHDPKVISTRSGKETRLDGGVVRIEPRLHIRELQKSKESFGLGRMMPLIAGARERAGQQCSSFAGAVFHGGDVSVLVTTSGLAFSGLVLLKKVTTEEVSSLHFERQVVEKIRRELHVTLARPK